MVERPTPSIRVTISAMRRSRGMSTTEAINDEICLCILLDGRHNAAKSQKKQTVR